MRFKHRVDWSRVRKDLGILKEFGMVLGILGFFVFVFAEMEGFIDVLPDFVVRLLVYGLVFVWVIALVVIGVEFIRDRYLVDSEG